MPPVRSIHPFLLTLVVTLAGAVRADDGPLDGASLRVGIGGHVEVGRWTECRLDVDTLPAPRCRLVARAADPDGHVVEYPGPWAEGAGPLVVYFASGRIDGIDGRTQLEVRLETPDEVLDRRSLTSSRIRTVPQDRPMIAIVGEPAGFEAYLDENSSSADRWLVVPLDGLDELPAGALGFEAIDTIVVAGNYAIDADRLAALREWVWEGGHLVLAVGREFEAYRSSEFGAAGWIPFDVAEEPTGFRELEPLVAFAQQNARIPILNDVVAARVTLRDGRVLASNGRNPLVARAVHGFGHVTFLAVDLAPAPLDPDGSPLAEWAGVDSLVERLIRTHRGTADDGEGGRDQRLSHSGIGDLATQLNATRESFDDVHRSSRWGVMGLIVAFLLVIGPLDYLLVHRVLGRPAWTWATFPFVVLLATVLAFVAARATNGDAVLANRIEILDVDVTTETLVGRGFVTLYSPTNRRYPVSVEAASVAGSSSNVVEPLVNWSGVPETTYGGMYRDGGLRLNALEYAHAEAPNAFENVPIPVWSTKPFALQWRQTATAFVSSDLVDPGNGRLRGTIAHHLSGPIEDWVVVYNNRLYRPPDSDEPQELEPGTEWTIDGPRELRTYLTGSKFREIGGKRDTDRRSVAEQTKYDPLSRDTRRLIEMITFHRAAGGTTYTGLENASLDRLDLTDLAGADRAVLLARLSEPVLTVRTGDGPVENGRVDTYIRVLLPVKRPQ